jgi:microcystin-dependent protein
MSYPEFDPEWAASNTYDDGVTPNKIRPDPSLRQYGYGQNAEPTAQELNWQLNNLYEQIQELKSISGVGYQVPINQIVMIANDSRNPALIYGYGQWTPYASGRVVIGAGTSTDANGFQQTFAPASTGGTSQNTLSNSQLPTHVHNYRDSYMLENFSSLGSVPSTNKERIGFVNGGMGQEGNDKDNDTLVFTNNTTEPVGGNQPINNLPPYIVCNMWVRIA